MPLADCLAASHPEAEKATSTNLLKAFFFLENLVACFTSVADPDNSDNFDKRSGSDFSL